MLFHALSPIVTFRAYCNSKFDIAQGQLANVSFRFNISSVNALLGIGGAAGLAFDFT